MHTYCPTEHSIQAVTPTLCKLLGISSPTLCTVSPLEDICQQAKELFHGDHAQKCLIFAPDTLGNHLSHITPSFFETVRHLAPIVVSLRAVMPSKTPVCFASMFTGAPPAHHGIRKYEKPILTCDTLFDALLRADKRVAIVAVKGCSIDRIFRGRNIDYFSEPYDPDVTVRALSLLKENHHDVIVVYHQEYDDTMHATTSFAPEAIQAVKNHLDGFVKLSEAVDRYWQSYHRIITFTPDHGAHINPTTGKGDHGEDIPEDMELMHFYGIRRRGE